MRILLLAMVLASGLAFSMFVYQQVVVEGAVGPAAMLGIVVLGLVFLGCIVLLRLSRTRHREAVGGILLAGSATILAYLAFDVIAGLVLIRPLSPPLVPDEYRHHRLVPNSHAEFRQRDFAYIQRVNNLGLRGQDATVEKPAGTKRVLMLGDSFTMGKGVEDDQTFSVLVERSLQQAMASCGGGTVEVLNGGVDSYAPVLSMLQFQRDLAPLDPDLVILNLDHSDLIQEAAYRGQSVRGPNGEVVAVPQVAQQSLYERFLSWTTRHLFFTRVVLVYVNRAFDHGAITVRRVVNEAGREHFAHTLEGDVDRTAQWRDVFESIGRIKAHADSLGMDFLLTTYPWAHQLGDSGWVPGRYAYMEPGERTTDLSAQTIRELSAAGDIQLLETYPVFRAYEGSEVLYFAYDPHWTPAGHEVMARALGQRLLEDYVPRWCGTR
jgi:hypothetical protein